MICHECHKCSESLDEDDICSECLAKDDMSGKGKPKSKLPTLTDEQRAEYIKQGGVKCPFCNDCSLESAPVQIDGGVAWQETSCGACGEEWQDIYKLDRIELKGD